MVIISKIIQLIESKENSSWILPWGIEPIANFALFCWLTLFMYLASISIYYLPNFMTGCFWFLLKIIENIWLVLCYLSYFVMKLVELFLESEVRQSKKFMHRSYRIQMWVTYMWYYEHPIKYMVSPRMKKINTIWDFANVIDGFRRINFMSLRIFFFFFFWVLYKYYYKLNKKYIEP